MAFERQGLETTGKHVAQQPQKERWQLKEMATRLWGFVWMVPAGAGVCFQRMMCGSVCMHTCTQARVWVGVCACTCVPVRVRACRCVYVREIISACVRRAEVLLPVVLRCLAAWRCIVLRRVAPRTPAPKSHDVQRDSQWTTSLLSTDGGAEYDRQSVL